MNFWYIILSGLQKLRIKSALHLSLGYILEFKLIEWISCDAICLRKREEGRGDWINVRWRQSQWKDDEEGALKSNNTYSWNSTWHNNWGENDACTEEPMGNGDHPFHPSSYYAVFGLQQVYYISLLASPTHYNLII